MAFGKAGNDRRDLCGEFLGVKVAGTTCADHFLGFIRLFLENFRIFIDEIDRSTAPGMAIAVDDKKAVGGKVVIVRVIDFPEGIGSLFHHTAPVIRNQVAGLLRHSTL